ncbi:hypothetical protein OPV22_028652 [Ensete ventricosum]|uniref:Uncharacterized protein n=1 Tax=Ensete ventricosum TaxID=4639 RepID=A0AAV8QB37_ENSVE|nr:hypothetical protein OPV22_028652 [Ensete ventricosum]
MHQPLPEQIQPHHPPRILAPPGRTSQSSSSPPPPPQQEQDAEVSVEGAGGVQRSGPAESGVELQRRTDDSPPRIAVTYVNGIEEIIDATGIPAQTIRQRIFDRGQLLETEQMFREAGEPWPVLIPEEEIHQSFPGTKPKKAEEQKQ